MKFWGREVVRSWEKSNLIRKCDLRNGQVVVAAVGSAALEEAFSGKRLAHLPGHLSRAVRKREGPRFVVFLHALCVRDGVVFEPQDLMPLIRVPMRLVSGIEMRKVKCKTLTVPSQ